MSFQNIPMSNSTTSVAILEKIWGSQMFYESYLRSFDKLLNVIISSKSLGKEVVELLKSASTFDRNGDCPNAGMWTHILGSNDKKAGALVQYSHVYAASVAMPSTIKRVRVQTDKECDFLGRSDKYYLDLIENIYPELADAVKNLHKFRYKTYLINIAFLIEININA